VILADVSEFQTVDWASYGAANPAVIIRAHNGYRADYQWAANLAGARARCSWRGFYQYLPATVDPVQAARSFQATTGPLLPGEVAILDLEEGSGDQRARRQAWLDTLQDPVEWTYSGLSFARAHLAGVRVEWLAAYGQGEPSDAHTLWQFTNAQRFAGISAPCDASTFNGTLAQLHALTQGVIDMTAEDTANIKELLNIARTGRRDGDSKVWPYAYTPEAAILGQVQANAKAIAALPAPTPSPTFDLPGLAAAIIAALPAPLAGTTLTAEAIAKAVNDDAAARLAS
jgi:hypothetical protein